MSPLYVFDHIHKCGGQSITKMLKDHWGEGYCLGFHHYLPEEDGGPSEDLNHIKGYSYRTRLIYGHSVGLLKMPTFRKVVWFTVLRHPIIRALSSYAYEQLYLRRSDLYFKGNVHIMNALEGSQNRIVRHLARTESYDVNNGMLNKAKGALKSYDFVGFLEEVEEIEQYLTKRVGLKNGKLPRINTSDHSALLYNIKHIKRVIEANQYDLELYYWALEQYGKA